MWAQSWDKQESGEEEDNKDDEGASDERVIWEDLRHHLQENLLENLKFRQIFKWIGALGHGRGLRKTTEDETVDVYDKLMELVRWKVTDK